MAWLPITDSLPGDACLRCDRGQLYVRSSRPTGIRTRGLLPTIGTR